MVDESKYLAPGLICLGAYFAINASMCWIVLWWQYKEGPKMPRPYGYALLVSLIPLGLSMYYFVLRVGLSTVRQILYSYMICFGGLVLAILPISYAIAIARGI